MILQYLSDNHGQTQAVQLQIPIEDWKRFKEKYIEFEDEEKKAVHSIPDWHVALGAAELKLLNEDDAGLRDWDEVKNTFRV